ncbi:36272_t:CDS:2, partial [Gigaspora margarita]
MSFIYAKVYNFLVKSPLDHISAVSAVKQILDEHPKLAKDNLQEVILFSVNDALLHCADDRIDEEDLNNETIQKNLRTLKTQLRKSKHPFAKELSEKLAKFDTSTLSWKVPLASGVLHSESKEIEALSFDSYKSFMEPAENMKVPTPSFVEELCNEFAENINENIIDTSIPVLSHNGLMKEGEAVLRGVTSRILGMLEGVWENPAFDKKFLKSQSEGTYVNNIIVPMIRAALKDLPYKESVYVSIAERQNLASKDRRGEYGKRPDVMLLVRYKQKTHELVYAECSRLVCDEKKIEDDRTKLWRELNDGMNWTSKSCKIDSDQFGILGIQVAAQMLHLSVLIRDETQIHR